MPYTKTAWVDDSTPGISATNLNNIEDGVEAALDFTELWQVLTIGSPNTWVSVNLSGYGVPQGAVAWIKFICKGASHLYGGVRKSGSALDRRETVDGNGGDALWPVKTTGANATVELYTQDTTNNKAYLVGWTGL